MPYESAPKPSGAYHMKSQGTNNSLDRTSEAATETPITGAMLYSLVTCPHRVTMDFFADPADREEPNAFVKLLWEQGSLFEQQVVEGFSIPVTDLSSYTGDEKERRTLEAMRRGEPLIYSGRIRSGNLLGQPDLLRKEGERYIAGDIKSGSGEEGPADNSKPKTSYAVQLALYTDILERTGWSAGRRAFVWDIHGEEVPYDFQAPKGKRSLGTLWQDYEAALNEAMQIVGGSGLTRPAYGATCKLCVWYTACIQRIRETDDLTQIPELGRSRRDAMYGQIATVAELASADLDVFIHGTTTDFPRIGVDTLRKYHDRARLLSRKGATPYARKPLHFPDHLRELFFDIEVDPMRDLCYLHGFIERHNGDNSTERFVATFADQPTAEAEKQAFAEAMAYLRGNTPCAIYYYSKYERTMYRKLQAKYPDVCTAEEVEALFDPEHTVDLYGDVVRKHTEWPVWDYSIKTLAKYLGFSWRDTNPSGAASIEWFHRWVETGDLAIRQRVLDYNEDDCRATRVLRDALERLPVVA